MTQPREIYPEKILSENGLWLGLAESCTGGLLGHLITNVAGSSLCFRERLVAYAIEARMGMSRVSGATLENYGVVR